MGFWWATLFVSFIIEPSVLLENRAISFYATMPETLWLYTIGTMTSGTIILYLATRVASKFNYLKWSLYAIGTLSILLPFFRLQTGQLNHTVHMLISTILFLSIILAVVSVSWHIKNKLNLFLTFSTLAGYIMVNLSLDFATPKLFNLLGLSQIIVLASVGAFLQLNFRREGSLTRLETHT